MSLETKQICCFVGDCDDFPPNQLQLNSQGILATLQDSGFQNVLLKGLTLIGIPNRFKNCFQVRIRNKDIARQWWIAPPDTLIICPLRSFVCISATLASPEEGVVVSA